MWEDVVGRHQRCRPAPIVFARNIAAITMSSAEAKRLWKQDLSLDAWVVWNIWRGEDPTAAELIKHRAGAYDLQVGAGLRRRSGPKRTKPAHDFFTFYSRKKRGRSLPSGAGSLKQPQPRQNMGMRAAAGRRCGRKAPSTLSPRRPAA